MDTNAIVRDAAGAQRAWENLGIAGRLRVLQQAGEALANQREALYAGLAADGLSRILAEYYGGWIMHQGEARLLEQQARWLVRRVDDSGGGGELLVRRADGLVLLVVPANSPTINGSALFSILLAGNGVIVRAPGNDRGLRFIVEQILHPALASAGISPALVPVITSKSRAFLGRFAPHPEVRTIVFFGNAESGRAVAAAGMMRGKKVIVELEGGDHMIVWKDGDLDRAVASARHAFDFSTQPCIVPKHIHVHNAVFDDFIDRFLATLPKLRTIEADGGGGLLGRVMRPAGYLAALAEAQELGQLLAGGFRMNAAGEPDDSGNYIAPTVVAFEADACIGKGLRCFEEEISFPLIPVVRFSGSDDAVAEAMVALIRESPFGLRTSLWTSSAAVMARFVADIPDVGLFIINDDHAQAPAFASPWGGPKRSGGPYGESNLFGERTSHLQAIGGNRLTGDQLAAITSALGCLPPETAS